jgi:hypothetical protein
MIFPFSRKSAAQYESDFPVSFILSFTAWGFLLSRPAQIHGANLPPVAVAFELLPGLLGLLTELLELLKGSLNFFKEPLGLLTEPLELFKGPLKCSKEPLGLLKEPLGLLKELLGLVKGGTGWPKSLIF